MKRSEALALINRELETLDDERVLALADLVQEMAAGTAGGLTRELSEAELQLLGQSREDFKSGRTYSRGAYEHEMATFLATLKGKYPEAL